MFVRRIGTLAVVVALVLPVAFAFGNGAARAPGLAASALDEVVAFESEWRFHSGTAPAGSWLTDRTDWAVGHAPFGAGSRTGILATTLTTAKRLPVTTYFQRSFGLDEVPAAGLVLTTWADDGIIAAVNGTEIARRNVPTGPIGHRTRASSAPASLSARAMLRRFAVPASVLRPGTNTLAVEVHARSPHTADVSFDAQLGRATTSAGPPVPGYLAGWGAPSWNDDFTWVDPRTGRPAIDPSRWNVRGRDDLGLLPDAAVADRSQVTVDGSGVAHLRADWLDTPVIRPSDQDGPRRLWHRTAYLDQRMLQRGDAHYAQKYGRWEIRAKVPSGPRTYGSLAAFWLRNSRSGEIDIMEAWGYNLIGKNRQRVDTATTTIHTKTSGKGGKTFAWTQSDYGAEVPVWKGFHTWAFEFTPDYAAVYVDGVRLFRVTPASLPQLWSARYFQSPLHVRLNLHVGASEEFWGLPDPDHRSWTTGLDFEVDHVRIWRYLG